jgi:ABC-type uncharacterized transport system permease subunit
VIGAVLLAHLVGDYLIQNHWMANVKTQRSAAGWLAAILHGVTYTIPFALITQSWTALAIIAGTHVVIDHWRLARYVVWFRNLFAPRGWRAERDSATGTPKAVPDWLAVWLLFIADNTLHLLINVAAIHYA